VIDRRRSFGQWQVGALRNFERAPALLGLCRDSRNFAALTPALDAGAPVAR